jgi:glutamate decarboxylase
MTDDTTKAPKAVAKSSGKRLGSTRPTYAGRYFTDEIPKHRIPEKSMPGAAAYQLIRDELNLDGNAAMNLASFVTTWMEPEAEKLISETLNKNLIDQDEYPQTFETEERIVTMLARLFNSPYPEPPPPPTKEEPHPPGSWGTATIGSSEAIMLGLLAHKWAWRKSGRGTGEPNLVVGADVHTCWEKFARYFDVDCRIVPLEADDYVLRPEKILSQKSEGRWGFIDENTIAVGGVVGTTFTGGMDDIEGINDLLLKIKTEEGWDIPLHVDGASGGFILPFVSGWKKVPRGKREMKWDFRLEQVKSINVSNHKFGLVYPGMGSVIFKDKADVPEGLPFKIDYLGGEMDNYSLNFSRGSAMVLAQYYNFLRLGMKGYRRIIRNAVTNARYLGGELEATGLFETMGDLDLFPIVVVKLTDDGIKHYGSVDHLSEELRKRGWIIPAYPLPPLPGEKDDDEVRVIRMVIRENVSHDMCSILRDDIANVKGRADSTELKAAPAAQSRHRPC